MRLWARAGLAVSIPGIVALLAWGAYEEFSANPNDVDPQAIAPRMLHDAAETSEYLKAFPVDAYKVAEVDGQGRFHVDDLDDVIKRPLRKGVMWEPYLVNLMPRHVRPGTTAIDVGAHIGVHTVTLARAAGRKGRVYAFEPQKKLHRELVHNLKLNGLGNVVALRFALGDAPSILEMSRSAKNNEGGTAIGVGGDRVELRTLDSFGFRNVSFIKIDVEGYEDHVLAGAAQTIRAQHPTILVEIQGGNDYDKASADVRQKIDATVAKLKSFGYAVRRVSMHDYLATYGAP
ncbi:MAG: FkbM family methyltransferase [Burkholderiales bacterium]